ETYYEKVYEDKQYTYLISGCKERAQKNYRHTCEEANAKWLIKKGLISEPYFYEIPEPGEQFEYIVVENDLS
ncbi:18944_t:CDS:2, partial [Funneliformis geosporum]